MRLSAKACDLLTDGLQVHACTGPRGAFDGIGNEHSGDFCIGSGWQFTH